jgi:hypothetical protein
LPFQATIHIQAAAASTPVPFPLLKQPDWFFRLSKPIAVANPFPLHFVLWPNQSQPAVAPQPVAFVNPKAIYNIHFPVPISPFLNQYPYLIHSKPIAFAPLKAGLR